MRATTLLRIMFVLKLEAIARKRVGAIIRSAAWSGPERAESVAVPTISDRAVRDRDPAFFGDTWDESALGAELIMDTTIQAQKPSTERTRSSRRSKEVVADLSLKTGTLGAVRGRRS
jgi:hypothetical protein